MTETELNFLKTQIDKVVLLETVQGQRLLIEVMVVFDEGETPDMFGLEVEQTPTGYAKKGSSGISILLADIASVQSAP